MSELFLETNLHSLSLQKDLQGESMKNNKYKE